MFNNYFQKRQSLHDRNLRDMKTLHVPVGYSAMALSSTKINGAKLWNELPLEIKRNDGVDCFKKICKKPFREIIHLKPNSNVNTCYMLLPRVIRT